VAKTALVVSDLFALSDALGMPLDLYENGKIEGKLSRSVVVPEISLKMNMTPTVVKSKVEWSKKAGKFEPIILVLVHVIGDLCLLLANDRNADEVICLVLDGSKMPRFKSETVMQSAAFFFEDHRKKSVANTMKQFLEFSVAQFIRGQYDTEWKEAA
jgi:hypothetical protein